ncbi:MAG: thioesterase family protein [Bacillota bacterium]|nr:thioesterase family protein [Bacillota bacterium]
MFVSETKFIVRYAETDQMGIVHHSNYPVWFEAGRTDFIKKMGMPYSRIEESGSMLPLIELKCNYKGYSKYEDEITVKTRIKEMTPLKLRFYYEVYRNNEPELITSGETLHVWTTTDLKPVNIKKHAPEIYQLVENAT